MATAVLRASGVSAGPYVGNGGGCTKAGTAPMASGT